MKICRSNYGVIHGQMNVCKIMPEVHLNEADAGSVVSYNVSQFSSIVSLS